MKTFKQFLNEQSYTPKTLNDYLKSLGYTRLGAGLDQTAWLDPSKNHILKIFGTARKGTEEYKSGSHTEDHMMFKMWAEYCNSHRGNKFLPKFYGWEAFEWDDKKFLQIKMEKLGKLPKDVGLALQDVMSYFAIESDSLRRKKNKIFMRGDIGKHHGRDANEGLNKLAILLGEQDFNLLYDTIAEIGDMGRKHGYGIDLHMGNFMYRSDGTPVIVDPFAEFV